MIDKENRIINLITAILGYYEMAGKLCEKLVNECREMVQEVTPDDDDSNKNDPWGTH